jgi:hypothetical protein
VVGGPQRRADARHPEATNRATTRTAPMSPSSSAMMAKMKRCGRRQEAHLARLLTWRAMPAWRSYFAAIFDVFIVLSV